MSRHSIDTFWLLTKLAPDHARATTSFSCQRSFTDLRETCRPRFSIVLAETSEFSKAIRPGTFTVAETLNAARPIEIRLLHSRRRRSAFLNRARESDANDFAFVR